MHVPYFFHGQLVLNSGIWDMLGFQTLIRTCIACRLDGTSVRTVQALQVAVGAMGLPVARAAAARPWPAAALVWWVPRVLQSVNFVLVCW
jgi:hypothetical protein